MKKTVLGIRIDDITIDQALERVQGWLSRPGKHYIVTPNPEIIVMAQKDKELLKILNNADLAIPDGVGLRLSGNIVCNTPGIDLMEALVKLASNRGFTIGLLGGRGEVAEETLECLKSRYPNLKVSFASGDIEVDGDGREIELSSKNQESSKKKLNSDLLFVAFGHPKQEKWIYENLPKLPVKVAMGVGGAFDYISGKVPRAPKWIRDLGFEWLFRLIIQPWRIKRQLSNVKYLLLLTKK